MTFTAMSNVLQYISMRINNLYTICNKTMIKITNNLDIVQRPKVWLVWFALWTTFEIRSTISIGSSSKIDWLIAKHLKHGKHHANKHMFPIQKKMNGVVKTSWLYHRITICFIISNLVMLKVLFVLQLFYAHVFF